MNYEEWEKGVAKEIRAEPVWGLYAYREALFLHDLVWTG